VLVLVEQELLLNGLFLTRNRITVIT